MADKTDIEAHPALPRRWEMLWLALYPLAWVALFAGSNIYWFLPAGLRLATLWLLPRKFWWLMAIAEWATILTLNLRRDTFDSLTRLVGSTVLPWCIYALMLWSFRPGRLASFRESLLPLLGIGLIAALLTAVALTGFAPVEDGVIPASVTVMVTSYAMGDFAGMVIIVPLILAARHQWGRDRRPWGGLFANGLVLLPVVVALGLPRLPAIEGPVYPLLLALFPLFGVAYRYGWRSGAIALALLGVGVHVLGDPLSQVWGVGQLQLLIVVSGCATLLLGVATETQRAQRSELTAAVQALSMRRTTVTDTANRLSSLEEEERRRIGIELHDVLGQDMTAIATRVHLVERTATEDSVKSGLASIGLLVADAHTHLREVIHHLHPAALDRFGLARALSEGPLAQMLRDQSIEYIVEIKGDIDTLNESTALALYRICQEAANNCVRHVAQGRFRVVIRLLAGPHDTVVSLTIDDDGGEVPLYRTRTGRGLKSIADRAERLGAAYHFNLQSGKPRHALLLRLPNQPTPDAAPTHDDPPL